MKKFIESDMYEPVKRFFLALDYEVRGEVLNCDIVLSKNDELIIIELKKNLNLTLILQAMERQKATNQVYIAIPRMKNSRSKIYKNILQLVKKLELGLITVAMDSPVKTVEILNFPPLVEKTKNSLKRELILREAKGRTIDLNAGGSGRRKLVTAYREKVIKIACTLEKYGELRPIQLVKEHNCDKNAAGILRRNIYNWFQKNTGPVYTLNDTGRAMLGSGEFGEIVEYYRGEV